MHWYITLAKNNYSVQDYEDNVKINWISGIPSLRDIIMCIKILSIDDCWWLVADVEGRIATYLARRQSSAVPDARPNEEVLWNGYQRSYAGKVGGDDWAGQTRYNELKYLLSRLLLEKYIVSSPIINANFNSWSRLWLGSQ